MADGFSLLNELGRGSYATVHLAKRKLDGKLYALKQVRLTGLKPKDVDSALKEVRFLSTLGHPHVISYREAFLDSRQEYLYIVLDYADKGDVEAKIREYASRKRRYTEAEVWRAASHIASGLAYLHENKILHRDIKAANIFVCQGETGNEYKIGDFNVSKVLGTGLMAQTQTGTPYYCCPEIWLNEPYDSKSDIYSFGCLLYEMCAQVPPHQAKTLEQLYKKVLKAEIKPIPKSYSPELFGLIKRCLSLHSKARPSAAQIQYIAETACQEAYPPNTQRARAKSTGQEVRHQFLRTINLKNRGRNLKSVLPPPKYEKSQQTKNSTIAEPSKNHSDYEGRLKLPKLSSDLSSINTKSKSDVSSRQRQGSSRKSFSLFKK